MISIHFKKSIGYTLSGLTADQLSAALRAIGNKLADPTDDLSMN